MQGFYIACLIIGFLGGCVAEAIINLWRKCRGIPTQGVAGGHQRPSGDS